jgi:Ca2+-binding EF-hand superfamily protein
MAPGAARSNKRATKINHSLRAAFVRSTAGVRQMENTRQESVTETQMFGLADELHYHPQEVMYVKKIFDEMDLSNDESTSVDELQKGVCHLLIGTKFSEVLVRRTCRAFWNLKQNGDIRFQEFLRWFAKHNFRDPDQEAAHLELQARQYQMTEEGMRQVMIMFDSVDVDKSGDIQIDEFKLLLAKILHIPRGIEVPEGHIQRMWSELDTSGDEKVTLEEFLPWWVEKQSRFIPYENIYANVRNLGKMKPDPPAYPTVPSDSPDDAYPTGPSDSPDDGAELDHATRRRHRS